MGEMTLGTDGDRHERVERALALLVQAARTSPLLRSAVALVEEEVRLLWARESLHDADCPMTNSDPADRTSCICDGLIAGGATAIRDTPEGGPPIGASE